MLQRRCRFSQQICNWFGHSLERLPPPGARSGLCRAWRSRSCARSGKAVLPNGFDAGAVADQRLQEVS